MGTILSFQPRTQQASRPPIALSTPPSIVIFPGVRYERYAAAETARATSLSRDVSPNTPPNTRS